MAERLPVLFHGGTPGLAPGDLLVPSPPHVEDGCIICEARAVGGSVTAGEYRAWAADKPEFAPALNFIADAPDSEVIDAPTGDGDRFVYLTRSLGYARFYAARSGNGTVYRVEPVGDLEPSPEDHFPTWKAPAARVLRILYRRVELSPKERRRLWKAWGKADRKNANLGMRKRLRSGCRRG